MDPTEAFIFLMENNETIETSTSIPTSAAVQLRLYDILIPILGIVIIVLNLAVVISSGLILRKGQQPRSTYLFLGNVALSDFLTGFAVLFGQWYPRAYRDEISCAIQIGMIVGATITSVYSVGLIAVDRYLYIIYGMQYQRYIYPNRARIMILITWIIGIIIGFLPAMGWRNDTDNGRICWFIIIAPAELVLLTTIIGLFPLLIIIILYSIILYHALRKVIQLKKAAKDDTGSTSGPLRIFTGGRRTQNNPTTTDMNNLSDGETPLNPKPKFWQKIFKRNNNPNENVKQKTGKSPSKWKAVKVVLFTAGSFFITWVPYFVASTWYVNCNPDKTPELCNGLRVAIASPLAILGFANSLLNPVIYAWWHNGFRESVRRMYFKARNRPDPSRGQTSAAATSTTNQSDGGVTEDENTENERRINPSIRDENPSDTQVIINQRTS